MEIQGLNHFLFSVSDLDTSIPFYEKVFGAELLVRGKTTAYFDLKGMWLALNEEKDIPRQDGASSYTHTAFTIKESDFDDVYDELKSLGVNTFRGGSVTRGINGPSILRTQMGISSNFIQEQGKIGSTITKRLNLI
ncbi:hypothetical protein HFA01_09570 [Halobacillus faecis]|uniref:VOC domain-containing protein n=1 Tax=Halobacillus faecis TaxID=360184 RepID=A0A511WNP2_9BACI|nr:hypothetical protein HFA01_09570 [Halobacillus faecis]